MNDINQKLDAAHRHQKAGRTAQAEILYRQVLESEPHNTEALSGLAAGLLQNQQAEEALEIFGLAATLRPNDPGLLRNLGMAYTVTGRLQEAQTCLERALSLEPESPECLCQLAFLRFSQGEQRNAEELYLRSLKIDPNRAATHFNLGNVYAKDGNWQLAAECYARAVEADPENWTALNNLGQALLRLGKPGDAEQVLQRALLLDPGNPGISSSLAAVYQSMGRFAEAENLLRQVAALMPSWPEAHLKLGQLMLQQGRIQEALAGLAHAYSLDENSPGILNMLGTALLSQGSVEESLEAFETSLELAADNPAAMAGITHAHLLQGDCQAAWPLWLKVFYQDQYPPDPDLPAWAGDTPLKEDILIWADLDLNESLLFLRVLPLISSKGAEVYLDCPVQWADILTRARVGARLIDGKSLPDAACQAPLGSIAALLKLDPKDLPQLPCLHSDPLLVEKWTERLGPAKKLKVALAWSCSDGEPWDVLRTPGAECWQELDSLESVDFIALQQGEPPPGVKLRPGLMPKTPGECLALMAAADVVVTAECRLAYLASAAGLPAWVLLGPGPGWSWGLSGDQSPWHPGLRVIRSADNEDWAPAGQKLRRMLSELADKNG